MKSIAKFMRGMNSNSVFCFLLIMLPHFTVASFASGQDSGFVVEEAVLKISEERSVPCQTSGVIIKNLVKEGSVVKAGQPIAKIDDALARLNVQKLEKELEVATAEATSRVDLEYAQKAIGVASAELTRALLANQRSPSSVAQSEIDQLSLVVEKSRAESEKTRFAMELMAKRAQVRSVELETGKKILTDHVIDSPIKGMVVEILQKEGEWVDTSQPIARVLRLDKLKSEVRVPASFALDGILGKSGEFIPEMASLESRKYPAKIVFVHPEANPVNSTIRVWVEIDNSDMELVAGLTGKLTFRSKPKKTTGGSLGPSVSSEFLRE